MAQIRTAKSKIIFKSSTPTPPSIKPVSVRAPVRSAPSSTPLPPPATPTLSPTTTPANVPIPSVNPPSSVETGRFSNSFFSWKGQAERLQNAGSTLATVLNPFSKEKIYITNPSTGLSQGEAPLLNNPVTRTALATGAIIGGYNVAAAAGAVPTLTSLRGAAAASSLGPAAGSAALGSGFRSVAIGAGAGFLAGSLLRGGGSQGSTQDQAATGTSSPSMNTTTTDSSYRPTYQDTRYLIRDSPGASIAGSPMAGSPGPYITPTQNAPFGQSLGQTSQQSQTDFGLLALLAMAALALGGSK